MVRCPDCDTEIDVDEDEVEEGEIFEADLDRLLAHRPIVAAERPDHHARRAVRRPQAQGGEEEDEEEEEEEEDDKVVEEEENGDHGEAIEEDGVE